MTKNKTATKTYRMWIVALVMAVSTLFASTASAQSFQLQEPELDTSWAYRMSQQKRAQDRATVVSSTALAGGLAGMLTGSYVGFEMAGKSDDCHGGWETLITCPLALGVGTLGGSVIGSMIGAGAGALVGVGISHAMDVSYVPTRGGGYASVGLRF